MLRNKTRWLAWLTNFYKSMAEYYQGSSEYSYRVGA